MFDKKTKNIIILWFPVFICCAIIYYLSAIPNLRSDLPNQWDFILRKIAHMAEYGILTAFIFRAYLKSNGFTVKKSISFAIIFALTYAFTDEYHQTFVFGRQGSLNDVFIDSLGIFFIAFLIYKKVKK
ncbi:MAG: VanZ family protein [Candidatus Pacebacteria bacterium]|nr:VanZ family protein [Candidatus Paceibacterota bacterium]